MIAVTASPVYQASLSQLAAYKAQTRGVLGRFVQLFLGLKFYGNQIPSMFSNQHVATGVLQGMLDDLYCKASRPANDCVLMLFEGSYLARTGLQGPGNKTPQNTWRNNFNIQKGIGCYAPAQDLASPTFLNQPRAQCRYLQPATPGGGLANASCRLGTVGTYRSEDHRKWLQIDASGAGYAVVDLLNTSNFLPYVAPGGARIPILPLIIALYHDAMPGLATGARQQLDVIDFATDFGFSAAEVAAYFDDSTTNVHNAALLRAFPSLSYTRFTGPTPAPAPPTGRTRRQAAPPAPVLSGTPTSPPTSNNGWDAEQFVLKELAAAGWTVHDVSRQKLGYDILAQKGRETRYVDVKSSVGYCSPTLTSREWQQAQLHGASYVLAIVENFNPQAPNVIFWVPDPVGQCGASQYTAVNFAISRSAWAARAVALAQI